MQVQTPVVLLKISQSTYWNVCWALLFATCYLTSYLLVSITPLKNRKYIETPAEHLLIYILQLFFCLKPLSMKSGPHFLFFVSSARYLCGFQMYWLAHLLNQYTCFLWYLEFLLHPEKLFSSFNTKVSSNMIYSSLSSYVIVIANFFSSQNKEVRCYFNKLCYLWFC